MNQDYYINDIKSRGTQTLELGLDALYENRSRLLMIDLLILEEYLIADNLILYGIVLFVVSAYNGNTLVLLGMPHSN